MKPQIELALALTRLAAVREVLELVTGDGSDRDAGRRALLLLYIIAPKTIGTQGDLARRLGVSEGRASQMLKPLRRHLLGKLQTG